MPAGSVPRVFAACAAASTRSFHSSPSADPSPAAAWPSAPNTMSPPRPAWSTSARLGVVRQFRVDLLFGEPAVLLVAEVDAIGERQPDVDRHLIDDDIGREIPLPRVARAAPPEVAESRVQGLVHEEALRHQVASAREQSLPIRRVVVQVDTVGARDPAARGRRPELEIREQHPVERVLRQELRLLQLDPRGERDLRNRVRTWASRGRRDRGRPPRGDRGMVLRRVRVPRR